MGEEFTPPLRIPLPSPEARRMQADPTIDLVASQFATFELDSEAAYCASKPEVLTPRAGRSPAPTASQAS